MVALVVMVGTVLMTLALCVFTGDRWWSLALVVAAWAVAVLVVLVS